MIKSEEQANLSYRELARLQKQRIMGIATKCPPQKCLWTLKVNPRTVYGYTSQARMDQHIKTLVAEGYDTSKFVIKKPRK